MIKIKTLLRILNVLARNPKCLVKLFDKETEKKDYVIMK